MRSFAPAEVAEALKMLGLDPKRAEKVVIEQGYVTVRRKGRDDHGNVTHIETVYPVLAPR